MDVVVSKYFIQCFLSFPAPLPLECTHTRGLPAPDHQRIQESFSHQHMKKMCASSMTLGFVFWETLNPHKIVNAMIVDHRSMWRKTQIPTYILLYQWTWVTLGSGTHKTPRSLKPFPLFLISQFCPPFYIWDLFTLSVFCRPTKIHKLGDLATLVQKASLFSASRTCGLDLQADTCLSVTFSRAVWVAIPRFHVHPGSDLSFFFK